MRPLVCHRIPRLHIQTEPLSVIIVKRSQQCQLRDGLLVVEAEPLHVVKVLPREAPLRCVQAQLSCDLVRQLEDRDFLCASALDWADSFDARGDGTRDVEESWGGW